MAICVKYIDITAKSSVNSAIVSLRPNELICNLRALVAVRFEQAINIIVLVFGGQVLRDVGTIDSHGITSGVTVYVVFRQPVTVANQEQVNDELDVDSGNGIGAGHVLTKQQSHTFLPKNADMIKPLLDDPETLRDMLLSDPHFQVLIDENASLRHFLASDSNIRDLFLTILNPARIEELSRKRDIRIMRMERVPGSYQVLHRFSNHLRKAHEDNIALTFQSKDGPNMDYSADNPQRGRENRLPLPNPWRQPTQVELNDLFSRRTERLVNDMKKKFDHILQLLQKGNLYMALQQSKALDEMVDNAHRELTHSLRGKINCVTDSHVPPPTPVPPVHIPVAAAASTSAAVNTSPLNLSDFLSCNHSQWEQKFHLELLELSSMGHTDRRRNICALLMSSGNVQMAVNLLEKWQH